jgi:tetratricopeptide (TPR) repeat protein
MKKFFGLFLLGVLFGAPLISHAQEASLSVDIKQGKPVKIRYTSKRHRGESKTLLIKDRQTEKRALITLPLVNEKEGQYEANFVILFDEKEDDAPKNVENITLDVYPIRATSNKIAQTTDIRKQNVVLLQSNQQEKERIAFELAESKKREEMERRAKALSEAEKKKHKLKAQQLAADAMTLYQDKKYPEAAAKFKEAIESDPENNKYYYQYGVSLFQMEEYQKSLVALSMAEDGDFSRVDKNYFIGMNYYRLNDSDSALKHFVEVRDENDETISATAAYYAGLLQYNSSRFGDAKASFDYVLDRSKDPRMDDNAESYLEKIDAIEQFNSKFKDKWAYNIYGGAMYDSNILNIADSNAPTDLAGLRFLYGANLERRMIYDYFKEWSIVGSVSDIYSTNTSGEAKSELQNADPLVFGIKSPYKWKTNLFGKNYSLTLTAGFESIMMNADGDGPRENTNNSAYVTISNTFFHSETWVANYDLDLRDDDSNIESSPEDDQSAFRASIGTTQILIGDSKIGQSYFGDLYYVMNAAQGDNQTYNRINLGLTYAQNSYWGTQAAARFDMGMADYPNNTLSRKDSNYGLTLSANKALGTNWSTSVSVGYSNNSSNVDIYSYNKITVSNMYTYTGAF